MNTNALISNRKQEAIARGVGVATQIYADRAQNAEIWDVEGNRYIDFTSGIAVVNTGHCHPKVIEAVKKQLERFTHTCHQVVPYENYVALAEKLNTLTPGNFAKKTIFVTTGAEATENAVKLARSYTKRNAVIAFNGGFHGRTFMAMTLTGKVQPYKNSFGTMVADVYHAPFPVSLHGVQTSDALNFLKQLFKSSVDPQEVAAMIIEPVQGEGGFYTAPSEFMKALRNICNEHGIVLITDEIQTGFARTGKLFAMEHYADESVQGDLVTMAKSLAGGFPLAAVTGKAEIMDSPNPGGLGGTYGGSPIGIAAAHAVLEVIESEGLCERANVLGAQLKQRLQEIKKTCPHIADIRGPGFMNAVEFINPTTKAYNVEFTNQVRQHALVKNLILLSCGVHANVIRFLAPITITDKVFAEGLDKLSEAILLSK